MGDRFQLLKDFLSEVTNDFSTFGIIMECIDILIVGVIIFMLLRAIRSKFDILKIVLFLGIYVALLFVTFILNLTLVFNILKYLIFVIIGGIIILYKEEFRYSIDKGFHLSALQGYKTSNEEKSQIIDSLVSTAVYLSERKTGALITIEGEESLDSYINKSIVIKSVITQELLTTLFYVGTATHDGAVIIRQNTIMCAGAYLPSTNRYDIPKRLGTRHRAAIGISEKCDALTIVVSEETGLISVTRNGGIEVGVSSNDLKAMLEQHYGID